MDVKKIAAEMKAKALADLKEAEEMERAAAKLEAMAAEFGWRIDIKPLDQMQSAEKPSGTVITRVVLQPQKKGKAADPTSMTYRSKSESVKIVRLMKRPVPLGELMTKLELVGVKLGGKNPNQALSANLGHCPELVSTKRGWWLAGEPLPPENTAPGIGRPEGLPGLN